MLLLSFLGPEIFVVLLVIGLYAIGIFLIVLFLKKILRVNEIMATQQQILDELKIMNGKKSST